MGLCTIPKVNKCTGIILLIVNILFPGKVFLVCVKFRYWYYHRRHYQ